MPFVDAQQGSPITADPWVRRHVVILGSESARGQHFLFRFRLVYCRIVMNVGVVNHANVCRTYLRPNDSGRFWRCRLVRRPVARKNVGWRAPMRWGCSKRLVHVGSGSFGNQLRPAPCPSGILDHAPLSSSYHVSHGPCRWLLHTVNPCRPCGLRVSCHEPCPSCHRPLRFGMVLEMFCVQMHSLHEMLVG